MTSFTPLRTTPGALTAPGMAPVFVEVLLADEDGTEVHYLAPDAVEAFKVARIDHDANSDRLLLVTNKVKYTWRPLREADGIWATEFRTPLPVDAIIEIATGDPVDPKTLSAYSSGDSPYVLGVVLETPNGQWVRSGGSFLPIAADDTTYADMDRVAIDPGRADEFLELYDKNYVTVADAASFESLGQ